MMAKEKESVVRDIKNSSAKKKSSNLIFSFFPVTNIPVLISGPCISKSNATGISNFSLNFKIVSVFSDCSSQLP